MMPMDVTSAAAELTTTQQNKDPHSTDAARAAQPMEQSQQKDQSQVMCKHWTVDDQHEELKRDVTVIALLTDSRVGASLNLNTASLTLSVPREIGQQSSRMYLL